MHPSQRNIWLIYTIKKYYKKKNTQEKFASLNYDWNKFSGVDHGYLSTIKKTDRKVQE